MTERAVVEQLALHLQPFGTVRIRAMFGEWMLYVDERPAAIVGWGKLYIKLPGLSSDEVEALCGNVEQPYPGAKGYGRVEPEQFAAPEWVEQLRAAMARPALKAARR